MMLRKKLSNVFCVSESQKYKYIFQTVSPAFQVISKLQFSFVFFSSVFSDGVDRMVSVSSCLPLTLLSHCPTLLSVFFRSRFLFGFLIARNLFNFCISVFSAHFPVVFNSSSSIQQLSESPLTLITAWPFSVHSFEYFMRSQFPDGSYCFLVDCIIL